MFVYTITFYLKIILYNDRKENVSYKTGTFCNSNTIKNLDEIKIIFEDGVKKIREYEEFCIKQNVEFFKQNHAELQKIVEEICK